MIRNRGIVVTILSLLGIVGLFVGIWPITLNRQQIEDLQPFIVRAATITAAHTAVEAAGGTVVRELPIINGVAAQLDLAARQQLTARGILVTADAKVYRSQTSNGETDTNGLLLYPSAATNAYKVHQQHVWMPKIECANGEVTVDDDVYEQRPIKGWGVGVAVVDSGFMRMASANDWKTYPSLPGALVAENSGRCIVYRDFLPRSAANRNAGADTSNSIDQHGHGTHVAATIADNRATPLATGGNALPIGVAPEVNLIIARALGKDGSGSYSDVIAAIDWVVANRERFNIQVLNLSLYANVTGPYWNDPLNIAVMRAWQHGLTVVVAAGNSGPDAGTITAPGNVPYVITVGAMTSGRYTSSKADELASYSSRGPTESAFVKPDVVVAATRTIAPIPDDSTLASQVGAGRLLMNASVDFKVGAPSSNHSSYQLSGTSMAAAQVSGIMALMLQNHWWLTNDMAKNRLLATARPAVNTLNDEFYSVWEQGAGLVDTESAVVSNIYYPANMGMDINLDLIPYFNIHYWGNTVWNPTTGQFALIDPQNGNQLSIWSGGRRASTGNSPIWSSGRRASTGANQQAWSGGRRASTGSSLTWAGNNRAWLGSSSSLLVLNEEQITSHMVVIDETQELGESQRQIRLPLLMRLQ